jgi:tetratricopeptide (TPR) repeat protein
VSQTAAERSFRKGLVSVNHGDYVAGLAYFEAAIRLEKQRGVAPPPRLVSYYGVCLAEATDHLDEATEACERALEAEFYNPDLYLNLGRVYLIGGQREAAHRTFVGGLRLQGDHPGIRTVLRRMGLRRRPVVRFLGRSNPVNRLLGRLAAR